MKFKDWWDNEMMADPKSSKYCAEEAWLHQEDAYEAKIYELERKLELREAFIAGLTFEKAQK